MSKVWAHSIKKPIELRTKKKRYLSNRTSCRGAAPLIVRFVRGVNSGRGALPDSVKIQFQTDFRSGFGSLLVVPTFA
jgi:hypothetical protein